MKMHRKAALVSTATAVALTSVACATGPERPDGQLARAESSVELARKTGAREFSPAALERAQTQLQQAQAAAAQEEYEYALHLAERAELDAELAVAQTSHGKADRALQELRASIDALRREIARNQSS